MNVNSKPFLTIGIPTWNRHTYLQKNVLDIINQVQSSKLQNEVEILVCDNASDDETEELCKEFAAQHSFFTYHRHPNNMGANANFQAVLTVGQGKYIWLLGDDDLLAPNIVFKVIKDIMQHQPDLTIGPALFDDTQKKATHHAIVETKRVTSNTIAKEDLIALAGKMSGLIFKKERITSILQKAEPLIKKTRTPWPHLAWLILLLDEPNTSILLLSYGTNQLVSAHWHNLLFDGKALLKIHFIEYHHLLIALKLYLHPTLYTQLIERVVFHKQGALLKCVLYATYLDSYWSLLKFSATFIPRLTGIKNKIYYIIFLLLPLSIPIPIRKLLFQCIQFRFEKLRKTITRIKKSKKIFTDSAIRLYNEDGV